MQTGYYKKNTAHLTNSEGLHPDNKNWQEFLTKWTNLTEEYNGWQYYTSSNHNYIVSPDGFVTLLFGYHGQNFWNSIKETN